jgi:hypothetical protein
MKLDCQKNAKQGFLVETFAIRARPSAFATDFRLAGMSVRPQRSECDDGGRLSEPTIIGQ